MWHLAYSESVQEEGPGARHSHSAVVHDQAMWVFGGMCDLQPRNDFWKWSFGKNRYSSVKPHSTGPSLHEIFLVGSKITTMIRI